MSIFYWIGLAIVVLTHIYMITRTDMASRIHGALNLVAAALIFYGTMY